MGLTVDLYRGSEIGSNILRIVLVATDIVGLCQEAANVNRVISLLNSVAGMEVF